MRKDHGGGITEAGGLTFLWALNDQCERGSLSAQLREFQNAGIKALVLHPRAGLLFPYGGSDWFEMIRWLAGECRDHGIEPILYDEDPYPSGNAGGRITAEHPEFTGCSIQRFEALSRLKENELFVFPADRLCWVGIVFPGKGEPIDLTERVGMIRRHWEKAEWDSRWYYPVTPLYPHPRAIAHHAEYALRMPRVPEGGKVVAFVIRPCPNRQRVGEPCGHAQPGSDPMFSPVHARRLRKGIGERIPKERACGLYG